MTTTILVWDDGSDQCELNDPTVATLESRIAALNGDVRTVVTVYRDDSHLAVGGNASDGLVVYCTFDDRSFWQLLSDGNKHDSITVVAGGQPGSYPANRLSTLEDAVAAATVFLQRGVRAESLRWASD